MGELRPREVKNSKSQSELQDRMQTRIQDSQVLAVCTSYFNTLGAGSISSM